MAYAALLSLAQILHQTLNRDYQYLILDEKKQIESLVEEVTFLQNCLSLQKLTQHMKTQIRDAAYIAEDIIESRIIDRFLTESAGHEDGSKEKVLIRFDVMKSWFVNLTKSDPWVLSTPMGFESSERQIAGEGEIEEQRINGIRQLAETRRFKAWFLDPSLFQYFETKPHWDAIMTLHSLATHGTKIVIISNSSSPASTTMEELRRLGLDTSLFVGAITSEDLRRDDASYNYRILNYRHMFHDQGSISPEMYKSAMEMAGVDAYHCIAVGCHPCDIIAANDAGISSIFTFSHFFETEFGHFKLNGRHEIEAITRNHVLHDAHPTYVLPFFTW